MTGAQQGISANQSLHTVVLLCNLQPAHLHSARLKLARLPSLVSSLRERFSDAILTLVCGVSGPAWNKLTSKPSPPELELFPVFEKAIYPINESAYDLVFVIRSERLDANFFAARVILEWLSEDISLNVDYTLFHYLDNRNLLGFRCPAISRLAVQREQKALLDTPHQPMWHRGSFLVVQHSNIDTERWYALSQEQQAQIMGQDKLTGERICTSLPSHTDKVHGEVAESLVWQQLPVTCIRQQGHVDLLWSRSAHSIYQWIAQRYEDDEDGFSDPLLKYQYNTLSATFFVPPCQWFEQLS